MESERDEVLVARLRRTTKDDKVIAYSLASIIDYPPIYTIKQYGLIVDLCVARAEQRKGVGERLLAKMFDWFKAHRIRRVELVASGKNVIGYSFWKKHGFKVHYYTLYLNK